MLMRRSLLHLTGAAGLAALMTPAMTACSTRPAEAGEVTSSVDRRPRRSGNEPTVLAPFALRLFDRVQPDAANRVISPFSVAVALAMTRNGAAGSTATEMDTVLGAPIETLNDELNTTLQALTAINDSDADVQVNVANSVWGQAGVPWEQPFLDALAANYGTGMRTVDFDADPNSVVDVINAWVSDETNDLIPDLLSPDLIDHLTRVVLVNAVYLKGGWKAPFSEALTTTKPFTTATGERVSADMMSDLQQHTHWHATAGWKASALDVIHPDLALALVLPTAPDEPSLSRLLGDDGLDRIFDDRTRANVQLTLPKWKMRLKADLKATLSELGMPTAFDPNRADLSGMTTREKLFIKAVAHEAVVTVDETGIEAAAATGVVGGVTSAPQVEHQLTLDRPFFYVLTHVPTRTPLFVGRVGDPTAG